MSETQSSINIYTNIERIAELARKHPERVFNSIHHVIDMSWLQEAAQRVRKDAAVGVDGQTYAEYEANLQDSLQGLLERCKTGTYRAPPVRRVHIPKADGSKRPIGIQNPARHREGSSLRFWRMFICTWYSISGSSEMCCRACKGACLRCRNSFVGFAELIHS